MFMYESDLRSASLGVMAIWFLGMIGGIIAIMILGKAGFALVLSVIAAVFIYALSIREKVYIYKGRSERFNNFLDEVGLSSENFLFLYKPVKDDPERSDYFVVGDRMFLIDTVQTRMIEFANRHGYKVTSVISFEDVKGHTITNYQVTGGEHGVIDEAHSDNNVVVFVKDVLDDSWK